MVYYSVAIQRSPHSTERFPRIYISSWAVTALLFDDTLAALLTRVIARRGYFRVRASVFSTDAAKRVWLSISAHVVPVLDFFVENDIRGWLEIKDEFVLFDCGSTNKTWDRKPGAIFGKFLFDPPREIVEERIRQMTDEIDQIVSYSATVSRPANQDRLL